MVPSCGILCHTTCGQLTYPRPHSEIDWKHSCLTLTRSSAFAALANLGYTSDIIIIIISERELMFMFAICRRPSVRPSVCLSVVCNVRAPYSGDWNFRQCFYIVRKIIYPSFLRRRMVGGGRPVLGEILGQATPVGAK